MNFLAVDFGAGSGRAIVGSVRNNQLVLDEIHRFPNRQIQMGHSLFWDIPALFEELKTGLRLALKKYPDIDSIAVDTWGVDFGLLDEQGALIGMPHCYRDSRTTGVPDKVFEKMPAVKIYRETGTQLMEINSVFQLYSMVSNGSPLLKIADSLLFMPDLFNYFLTGNKSNEYTIASTSGLLNCSTKSWSDEIFGKLNLPRHLMQDITFPGQIIGTLSPEICHELNCRPIKVIAVGSHDTASAVAAVNSMRQNRAYISSGTWSLMGVSADQPVTSDEACNARFTNEGGVWNDIRFLRNITGLWILQSVRKEWEKEGCYDDFSALSAAATSTKPFQSLFDVDDPAFVNPPDMRKAIAEYCNATGQVQPASKGEFVRAILESLALKYRLVLKRLEQVTENAIEEIQIIGGGSQNSLLCQLTADACNVTVHAGPVEATAIGNIMMQAVALGAIDREAIADVIDHSFESVIYHPQNNDQWNNLKINTGLW